MYNLLITGDSKAWEKKEYQYEVVRFGEFSNHVFSDRIIRKSFLSLDDEAIEKLTTIPSLFGYEGEKNDYRIGYLHYVEKRGDLLHIKFEFDLRAPKIPFTKILDL